MLVIPQAALTGKMKGKRMQYHNACNKDLGRATRHDCALIATIARFRQSLPFKAGGASPRPAQVPRTVCAFGTNMPQVASGPCARRRALGQRCKAPWRSSTRGPPASRHGALAALHLVVYKTLCAHGYTLRFCRRGEATGCTHCAAPTLRSMVIDRPSSWIAKGARTRTTWNVEKNKK